MAQHLAPVANYSHHLRDSAVGLVGEFGKDGGPGLGDVHVNGVGGLGPGRSAQDIEDEAKANQRIVGDIPTVLAKEGGLSDAADRFDIYVKASGADEELGIIFGFAIITKEKGVPYLDLQGNTIGDQAMTRAAVDFMKNSRMAGQQHERMDAGQVVFSFPLAEDIAKAMGITSDRYGLMVGIAPDAEMMKAYKAGKFTGFSIGGEHQEIDGKPIAELGRVA
jgi:hypothetical protein